MKNFIEISDTGGKKHLVAISKIVRIENSAQKQSYVYILGGGMITANKTYDELLKLLNE